MDAFREKMKHGLTEGLAKGWGGFLWMLKILVPISFLTFLLDCSGVLSRLDVFLTPLMGWLSLPAMAALPLVVGMLTGIYGGIAAMTALPLTEAQMTLIAVFLLNAHALIQEGIVQGKSGLGAVRATLWRLAAAVASVMAVAPFLELSGGVAPSAVRAASGTPPFVALLADWGLATVYLSAKIFAIIMTLMILLELMKVFHLTDRLVRMINPLLWVMGLGRRVGLLWLTAAVFGVSYGAAVIVAETRQGGIDRKELERLHVSVGINHGIIEDPLLFMSMGLGAVWMWLPRFAAAIAAVQVYNGLDRIKGRFSPAIDRVRSAAIAGRRRLH